MTDKEIIVAIRAEIKRRMKHHADRAQIDRSASEAGARQEDEEILSFINSLWEKPKCMYSKDNFTDEDRKTLCDGCRESNCSFYLNEDLEEASKEWLRPQLDKSYANYGEAKMMELTHFDGYAMLDAIEFGAKWQKAKDESITEDLGEYINELSKQFPEVSFAKLSRIAVRVAQWQKEQMLRESKMSGWVARDKDGSLHIFEVKPRRSADGHQWWDRDYQSTALKSSDFPDLKWEDEPVCVKLAIIKED